MMAVRALCLGLVFLPAVLAQPLLDFPTENRALLEGRPEDFYMFVERDFEGVKTRPWEGGQFGYVRGPVRREGDVAFLQLHEGIDIRPVRRDASGEPTDAVRAAAAGKVVHVSREAGASNYGRYVVIEHLWEGCPYYTLYAHLASTSVEPGQVLRQGDPIGILGYTGAGIDRERAHVHFEVCLILSPEFSSWHDAYLGPSPNRHGIFNGLNLVGVDPAKLLLRAQKDPRLSISATLAAEEPAFKITVKASPHLTLLRTYPWLVAQGAVANPPAWTISFTRHGVPIAAEPSREAVEAPVLAWVNDSKEPLTSRTKGYGTGPAGAPRLNESGVRFARLLTWPD